MTTQGERDFFLHHRGKSDGWLLEELPAGERPTGMWASDEGGLWTLAGERLRWRDTESIWHDVALPEGMTAPSVALTTDRTEVWVAGQVGWNLEILRRVTQIETGEVEAVDGAAGGAHATPVLVADTGAHDPARRDP